MVDRIVDRTGREHQPDRQAHRIEIAPGVATFPRDGAHYLLIRRAACPVRVRFLECFEYVSYDSSNHNYSSSQPYWVRYEAMNDPT